MPYRTEWVPAEIALNHGDAIVYHAYKDDDADCKLVYWFIMDEDSDSQDAFDVRELKAWRDHFDQPVRELATLTETVVPGIIQLVLITALENGEIKN